MPPVHGLDRFGSIATSENAPAEPPRLAGDARARPRIVPAADQAQAAKDPFASRNTHPRALAHPPPKSSTYGTVPKKKDSTLAAHARAPAPAARQGAARTQSAPPAASPGNARQGGDREAEFDQAPKTEPNDEDGDVEAEVKAKADARFDELRRIEAARSFSFERGSYPYLFESYAQWISLTVLLSSLAVVMANTGKDQYLASFFAFIGMAIHVWSTPFYFINRWKDLNRGMLIGLMFIVICIFAACVWTIVHVNTRPPA